MKKKYIYKNPGVLLNQCKKKVKLQKKNLQKKKLPSPEIYQMLIYSHICLLFYQFSNLFNKLKKK